MILYFLYRIGHFIACALPLGVAYRIACATADIYSFVAKAERAAIRENLKIVLGKDMTDAELAVMARKVFRNFAKYLVDFFRVSMLDEGYLTEFVKVEGIENVDTALARGKGVIMLSAHIGNWELGGVVLAKIGYPISAVVLSHQNKSINDFFTRQRLLGNMRPIEIGLSLRGCYKVLKKNGLLGLLGDRDFLKNGLRDEFFGHEASIPRGPAVFSHRVGATIVPSFMLREPGDKFRLVFEKPISPEPIEDEDAAIRGLTRRYLAVLEDYIRRYPTQWFVFKKVWNNDEKSMQPDTII